MRLPFRPIAVAVGGMVGSWLRWGLAAEYPVAAGTFPVTTLAVNVTGAALLGVVLVVLLDRRPSHPGWHALLGTGVMGALTTFSTFAVEVVELARTGDVVTAVVYATASIVLGLAAILLTITATRRVVGLARPVVS